ncbi:MAG: oxidoreductase [Acidimicrobiia bacterium]|nr:oxidoreductase [Acidimicrobiia bacterium]
MTGADARPRVAVWKFASCDGCQLTLLDCEDELLPLTELIDIAYFLEATSAESDGPFDLSIVEGSISTPDDVERIQRVREQSHALITIGACAIAGGIQALRNFGDVEELLRIVYATPGFLSTLDTVTPISDHVTVDFELRGCPIDKRQLLEVISAFLVGRRPEVPTHDVCFECKAAALPCVLVAHGTPCLGPVTHAGCGALCPRFGRGCYGCFGPMDSARPEPLVATLRAAGMDEDEVDRLFHTFNAWAEPFREQPAPPVAAPVRSTP